MASVSTTYEDYDANLYNVYKSSSETVMQWTINFGIGAEKNLDFGYIFGDFMLNLPANNVNGIDVAIDIPTSISLNVGVRIPFG
jgi:hypothetical protein